MKFYAHALIAAAIIALLPSCKNDDPKLDSTTPLYQQYEVYVEKGETTVVQALANFRAYNQNGQRVELNNGASISVNNHNMTYSSPEDNTTPPYTYFYQFENTTPTRVTFRFNRTEDRQYVNSVDLDEVDPVVFSAVTEIQNGESYSYTTGLKPQTNLIRLVPKSESTFDNAYTAQLLMTPAGATYRFTDVPAGVYYLCGDAEITTLLKNNDSDTAGTMHLVVRTLRTVTVTE